MKKIFENWSRFLLKENLEIENLSLYIENNYSKANEQLFVIYNFDAMKNIKNLKGEAMVTNNVVLSMIKSQPIEKMFGKCYGARQIIRAGSNNSVKGQGIGFLTYQIAMVYGESPITGDRSGTSDSAKRVYDKLPAQSKKFDDIQNPQTPPKEDDCYVSDPDSNKVDKAYWIEPGQKEKIKKVMSVLISNHKKNLEFVQKEYNIDPHSFLQLLDKGSQILFAQQYSKYL